MENPIDYIDQFEPYNELCLPRNTSDKRKKLMCKNFNGVNTYRIYNECDYNVKYQFAFMSFELYLIIVLVILGISFIIIYYNNYLIRKKQKLFNVPSIFPETLFPNANINNEYQKLNDNNMGGTTYNSKYYNNI